MPELGRELEGDGQFHGLNSLRRARDPLDRAQPIVERAFGRLDQDMLDTGLAIGGEPRAERAVVLAVPAVAQRDREIRLRPLLAQPRARSARPASGDSREPCQPSRRSGAGERRLRAAADPDRDRLDRLRQHAHVLDHRRDVARRKADRVLAPHRPHHRDALVHAPAALAERHAERGELGLHPADPGAEDQPPLRQVLQGRQFLGERQRVAHRQYQHAGAEPDPAW